MSDQRLDDPTRLPDAFKSWVVDYVGLFGTMLGANVSQHALPCCRVYNSANISLSSGTEAALTFDTETFDSDTIHDTSSNTSRLTCKTAGIYLIYGQAKFAASAAGSYRWLRIKKNNTTYIGDQIEPSLGAASTPTVNVATVAQLIATDYIELIGVQDSGGALNVVSAVDESPVFGMARLGGI